MSRFTGWASFAAGRAEVWEVLSDPTRLGGCLPVRLAIEPAGSGRFRATGRAGNAWFSTQVQVDLEVFAVERDQSLRIVAHGAASGMTFDGWIAYVLRPGRPTGPTAVDWEVDVSIRGGFSGQVTRVVEERGEAAIDELVVCLRSQVEV